VNYPPPKGGGLQMMAILLNIAVDAVLHLKMGAIYWVVVIVVLTVLLQDLDMIRSIYETCHNY
jgi:hypothetical protein